MLNLTRARAMAPPGMLASTARITARVVVRGDSQPIKIRVVTRPRAVHAPVCPLG